MAKAAAFLVLVFFAAAVPDIASAAACGAVNTTIFLDSNILANGTCFIVNASNIVIDGAGFKVTGNTSGYGINVTGFSNVTIRNFGNISNFTYGIYLSGSQNSTVRNNTVASPSNINTYGVYLTGSSYNISVSGNTITTAGENGFAIHVSSSSRNNVSSNNITTHGDDGHGIRLASSANNTVYRNTINTSYDFGHGIYLFNGDDNTISSNNVTTNAYSARGIYLDSGSGGNTIMGNNITTRGFAGSAVGFSSSGTNTVVSNVISTSAGSADGIDAYQSGSINATGNVISVTAGTGFDASSGSLHTIDSNTITAISGRAVYMLDSYSNFSRNNYTISTSLQGGIYIYGAFNSLTGERVNATGAEAVHVTSEATGTKIIDMLLNGKVNITSHNMSDISVGVNETPPAGPPGRSNISGFLTVSSYGSGAKINFNVTYSDGDISGLFEDSVRIYRQNGTTLTWSIHPNSTVDTDKNIISSGDITGFPIAGPQPFSFAPFGDDDYCRTLTENAVLARNLTSNGTCITIGASNLVIDGNGYAMEGNSSGYGINNSAGYDNITIKDFMKIGNFTNAIYAEGMSGSLISNNTINGSSAVANPMDGYGMHLYQSPGANITLNRISTFNVGGYAIKLNLSGNSSVTLNTLTPTGASGWGVAPFSSSGLNITSNAITTYGSNGRGVRMWTSHNSNISYNNITTMESSAAGIDLDTSDSNNVSFNIVVTVGDGAQGIRIYNFADVNTVRGNSVSTNGTDSYGIDTDENSDFNVIYGNNVTTMGRGAYGLRFRTSDSNNASSNSVLTTNTSAHGAYLFFSSVSNLLFLNNITTIGNSSDGAYLNSDSNNLTSNTIATYSADSDGAYFSSAALSYLDLNSISTTGPFSDGFRLSLSSSNSFLSNNISSSSGNSSPSYGIYLDNADDNDFTLGRTSSTSEELYSLSTSSGNTISGMVLYGGPNLTSSSFLSVSVDVSASPPPPPSGKSILTSALNITNLTSTSFIYYNLSYSEPSAITESTLGIYRYNESSSSWAILENSTVDASRNVLSAGNVTSFSLFAPFGDTVISPTTTVSAGSAGGGGGGGSSTPTEAKQSILITTVKPSTEVKGTFTNALLDIREIIFTSKTESSNARVEVTQTSARPASASDLTDGEKESYKTYSYIKITHTNLVDADLTNVKLTFEVNKSWLADRGYRKDQVHLQRFADGKWTKLSTRLVSESDRKYKYEADSPGLSVFVISVAVPVSASSPTGGSAAPSVTEETTTTTVKVGEEDEEKGGSPLAIILIVIVLVLAGGAYYFKDKLKPKEGSGAPSERPEFFSQCPVSRAFRFQILY